MMVDRGSHVRTSRSSFRSVCPWVFNGCIDEFGIRLEQIILPVPYFSRMP